MVKSQANLAPFREHWSDNLIRWIRSLRIPPWLFYLLLLVLSGLVLGLMGWLLDRGEWSGLQPIHFIAGVWLTGYLIANHFLVTSAETALKDFKASYELAEDAYQRRLYEFTHIPRGPGWIWSLIGVLLGAALPLYLAPYIAPQFDLPTSGTVLFGALGTPFFTLAFYRIYHQMRIVVNLFASIKRIDLYDLGSIYALALFPVRVVILIILTFWVNPFFILYPGTLADPLVRFMYAFLSLSTAIVIVPLRGVTGRLKDEKEALLRENGRELTFAREELYHRLHREGSSEIQELEKGIQALFDFRKSIEGISTLPWKPETIRWLITVLLLPMLLLIIQFLLQRFFGG